jgi:hypothetical protein
MSSESSVPRPFQLLSFEGLDLYARAWRVATRVVGLAEALANRGFEMHGARHRAWRGCSPPSQPGARAT